MLCLLLSLVWVYVSDSVSIRIASCLVLSGLACLYASLHLAGMRILRWTAWLDIALWDVAWSKRTHHTGGARLLGKEAKAPFSHNLGRAPLPPDRQFERGNLPSCGFAG